jgi:uncharacterized protein (TIGR00303 family)
MPNINFVLVIAGTELINTPGISAAGASSELLKYTPALDAEFIYYGQTKTLEKLPVSPSGIVSPALISKACLNILGAKIHIINLGAHQKPQCPHLEFHSSQSLCPSTGQALSPETTLKLFESGKNFALNFKPEDELIIAECVVGGTTTALGLLTGLGYECFDWVSSSIPEGNHALKKQILLKGLTQLNSSLKNLISQNPLFAISAFGDAMQAFTSGLAIMASNKNIKTTLAGGSQMLAIKSLIDRLASKANITLAPSPWVVNDKSANYQKLINLCTPGTQYLVFDLSQKLSSSLLDQEVRLLSKKSCARELSLEEIFNQYNQGHVKEGIGIGGLLNAINYL